MIDQNNYINGTEIHRANLLPRMQGLRVWRCTQAFTSLWAQWQCWISQVQPVIAEQVVERAGLRIINSIYGCWY